MNTDAYGKVRTVLQNVLNSSANVISSSKAVAVMLEKLEIVSQMFHGFPYENYFEADTGKKLSLILAAEEHILGLDDGKKRFVNEVTALSQAFSIAIPHERAMVCLSAFSM